ARHDVDGAPHRGSLRQGRGNGWIWRDLACRAGFANRHCSDRLWRRLSARHEERRAGARRWTASAYRRSSVDGYDRRRRHARAWCAGRQSSDLMGQRVASGTCRSVRRHDRLRARLPGERTGNRRKSRRLTFEKRVSRSAPAPLALEKSHLHARKENHIVIPQLTGLLADRSAIDERIVAGLAAVDVHDEEAVSTARNGGDLHAGSSQRRERLVELELAASEGAAEHLELGLW